MENLDGAALLEIPEDGVLDPNVPEFKHQVQKLDGVVHR